MTKQQGDTDRYTSQAQQPATQAAQYNAAVTQTQLRVGGGIGSQLPKNTDSNGNFVLGDEDLFRYMQNSAGMIVPSLTTDKSATVYFSIVGGATGLANFNQSGSGDFADWANESTNCEFVQREAACGLTNRDISLVSPEGVALQALGYDPPPCLGDCGNWHNPVLPGGGASYHFVLKGDVRNEVDTAASATDPGVNGRRQARDPGT